MESEDSCLLSPSDPNTTLDQTQRSRKGKHEQMSAACPSPASPAAVSAVSAGARKRSVRCKVCRPRRAEDCGTCDNCLDKPKFGGPNKKKKTCVIPRYNCKRYIRAQHLFPTIRNAAGVFKMDCGSVIHKRKERTVHYCSDCSFKTRVRKRLRLIRSKDVYLPRRWTFFQTSLQVQVYSSHQDL